MLRCMRTFFPWPLGWCLPTSGRRSRSGSPVAAWRDRSTRRNICWRALFENGEDAAALALMTAPGDRSWRHMVDSGATITWEAWDQKYKPNQDWNHAWGAAPANLLPRFVLGAQPLTPGWSRALIQPHPGALTWVQGRMPTPRGELSVSWRREKNFTLTLTLPTGMTAKVELPALEGSSGVWVDGARVEGASRRPMVDFGKGSVGNRHDRRALITKTLVEAITPPTLRW